MRVSIVLVSDLIGELEYILIPLRSDDIVVDLILNPVSCGKIPTCEFLCFIIHYWSNVELTTSLHVDTLKLKPMFIYFYQQLH